MKVIVRARLTNKAEVKGLSLNSHASVIESKFFTLQLPDVDTHLPFTSFVLLISKMKMIPAPSGVMHLKLDMSKAQLLDIPKALSKSPSVCLFCDSIP